MILNHRISRSIRRTAFTLMEMLVVVAIIVALAGLGGYYFIGALNDSKISSARIQAKTITDALDSYYRDHNQYPPQSPGLEALLQKTDRGGPYLKSRDALADPWGRPQMTFQYDPSGSHNTAAGAVVVIPDVYIQAPDGRLVGNWSEGKK